MATQVFLQPASSKSAQKHYSDTVLQPVAVSRITPRVPVKQLEASPELKRVIESSAVLRVWGVTPGKLDSGKKGWERLRPGDIGLFARAGTYFAKCRVAAKAHSPAVATHLWPRSEGGQTWEYIYFLSDVSAIDIPYEEFNAAIGSAPNRVPLGFLVLTPEESAAAINAFQLTK